MFETAVQAKHTIVWGVLTAVLALVVLLGVGYALIT
jgi:hypothetical protein